MRSGAVHSRGVPAPALPPLIETAIRGWTLRVLAGLGVVLLLALLGFGSVHRRAHRKAEALARAVMGSAMSGTTVQDVDGDAVAAIREAGPGALRACQDVGPSGAVMECVFELARGGQATLLIDGEEPRLISVQVER